VDFKPDEFNKDQIVQIPYATIKRLPIYQRYLSELANKEVERISSRELAVKMGTTPSQLRQDLSYFGSFGQQGYGYRVEDLLQQINRILGLDMGEKMVLVGAGHLGTALANYNNFMRRGLVITAIFDQNPNVVGKQVGGIIVRDIKELPEYLKVVPIEIGIIATPSDAAQEVVDQLLKGGVKGIWNFASVSLFKVPDDVILENVHISESLFLLSFKLQQRKHYRAGNQEGESR
jgi:AT-rich DNA-binding protein